MSEYQRTWDALNRLLRSGRSWSGHELNCVFVNLDGNRFADVSYLSGMQFYDDGRAAVIVDWDGDGDQDVWLKNRTGPQIRFMRNTFDGPNRALVLRLVGRMCNRDAIGARVTVQTDARKLTQSVQAGGGFLSQSSKTLHFGLRPGEPVKRVHVRWPGGGDALLTGLEPGKRYEIVQGESTARELPTPTSVTLAASELHAVKSPGTAAVTLAYRIPLPDLLGTGFDGERLLLSQHRGKPVLINFWAQWCAGCIGELKEFVAQRKMLEDAGLTILAVSLDETANRDKAAQMAKQLGLWFPTGMAERDDWFAIMQAVLQVVIDWNGDLTLPTSLLLDAEGRLARIYSGPIKPADLLADVKALERTSSAAAGDADRRDRNIVALAAAYPGRWEPVDFRHSQTIRLLQLSEGLIATGNTHLARLYVDAIPANLRRYAPPPSTYRRVATVFRVAADQLAGESASDAARYLAKADEIYTTAANGYAARVRGNAADATSWNGLADALAAMTDRESAAALLKNILAALPEPRSAADHRQRGKFLFNLRRWTDTIPYLRAALQSDPSDANSRYRLGITLMRLGRATEGASYVERALSELPPLALAEVNFADDLAAAGETELAIKHYRRAIELDPQFTPARQKLDALLKLRAEPNKSEPNKSEPRP